MGGLLGQASSASSSMATMSKAQMLYNYGLSMQVQPYMQGLNQRIEDRANQAQSTYQAAPDWNRFVQNTMVAPAQAQLDEQIKGLQHTNERFSSGRFAREASAQQAMNDSLLNQLSTAVNEERAAQMTAEEAALARQQQYKNMLTGMIVAPVRVKTQQSSTYTDNGLIGGIGGIGRIIGQQKGGG